MKRYHLDKIYDNGIQTMNLIAPDDATAMDIAGNMDAPEQVNEVKLYDMDLPLLPTAG